MDMQKLSQKITEIEMPKEMKDRIIRKCHMEMEEKIMSKKKPVLAIASFVFCLCLTGVTALANTEKLQGFFQDITGWNGAVTGTIYKQATEEIALNVITASSELTAMIEIADPAAAPYFTFEQFGIERYKIVDQKGNIVIEGETTESVEITDGKASITIPVATLAGGNYKLVITEFVGSSKADQPLVISGNWECEFTR